MRAGAKRSKPAATAVWVVNRLPARVTARDDVKGLACFLHETPGAFQHGEGRMAFVQVTDFRLDAERASNRHPPIPSTSLLFQPQLRPAPVQLAGNPSMSGVIRRVIAVQQVKLHSADLDLPGAQPDRVTG